MLTTTGPEYTQLKSLLDESNAVHTGTLTKLKRRLRQETFTADYIFEIINDQPDLVRSLYLAFASKHYVQTRGERDDFIPTLSYQRLQVDRVLNDTEIKEKITRTIGDENQLKVMMQFLTFNQHVL